MDTNKPLVGVSLLVAGVLFVGGAVASGGGVWYLQHRATQAAERRAESAERTSARLQRNVLELEAQVTSVTAALERASATSPAEEPAAEPVESGDKAEDGKRIGYVVGTKDASGQLSLVVDYADMLTGDEAVKAHKADGLGEIDGEAYYIRNVNPLKRTLPVAGDATVVVWSWFAETEDIKAKEISLGNFAASMPDGAKASDYRSRLPYWLTVSGGEIVRIEEQFLP